MINQIITLLIVRQRKIFTGDFKHHLGNTNISNLLDIHQEESINSSTFHYFPFLQPSIWHSPQSSCLNSSTQRTRTSLVKPLHSTILVIEVSTLKFQDILLLHLQLLQADAAHFILGDQPCPIVQVEGLYFNPWKKLILLYSFEEFHSGCHCIGKLWKANKFFIDFLSKRWIWISIFS